MFIKSNAPPAKKNKHVVLTLAQKIHIIERLEACEVAGKLAKDYGVGNSTISDMKRERRSRPSLQARSPPRPSSNGSP